MDKEWLELVMDILVNLVVTSYETDCYKEEVSQQ